jgi:hypothetical protein
MKANANKEIFTILYCERVKVSHDFIDHCPQSAPPLRLRNSILYVLLLLSVQHMLCGLCKRIQWIL